MERGTGENCSPSGGAWEVLPRPGKASLHLCRAPGCPCPADSSKAHPSLPSLLQLRWTLVSGQRKAENPSSFRCRVHHCHTLGLRRNRPRVSRTTQKSCESLCFSPSAGGGVKMPCKALGPCPVRDGRALLFPVLSTCWDRNGEVCWVPNPMQ